MRKLLIPFILFIALSIATPLVSCNPYAGAETWTQWVSYTTNQAICSTNFNSITNPSLIPSGNWLCSVLSVAGGASSSLNGYIYQDPLFLLNNNTVIWNPEIWASTVEVSSGSAPFTAVGNASYAAYYEKIIVNNTLNKLYLFAYPSGTQVLHDTPTIYKWASPTTYDTQLLVGSSFTGSYTEKCLQAGVESSAIISNFGWKVYIADFGYYSSSAWKYLPSTADLGSTSIISYNSSMSPGWLKVGGADYTGVQASSSSSDTVYFNYTGTTLLDPTTLWSNNGTISDIVSVPYTYQS